VTLSVDDRTGTGDGVLERFLADIVVDDYAAGAGAGGGDDPPGGPSREGSSAGVVLSVLVALLIGVMIAAALANTRLSSADRQQTRAALSERISTLATAIDARQLLVDQRATDVQALQDRLLAASQDGPATADTIARLSAAAGATPLSGPGITVTIDDAPDAEAGSLNRVLDRDLQDIVNVLWQSGAEGIAINDQRLTGTSAIRAAGEAILVNYQPLARPYRVAAVGALRAATEGSRLQRLIRELTRDYGLAADLREGDVALPAGEVRSPRFASTVPGRAAVASTDSGGGVGS
jgi:uncharacterized protein YlxW (UPF0749 family)